MISYVRGDIFNSTCQTLVNPVNTDGVMGAGLAKRFKERYPEMFRRYQVFCKTRDFHVGTLWLYRAKHLPWVLCFPTKMRWQHPSRIEWIAEGLMKLKDTYEQQGITSIAIPPLGCGLGGLNFEREVKPLIVQHLAKTSMHVQVFVK